MIETDLLIVGAGPAGLAAGIHAARAGLKHIVVDADKPGGILRAASLVENLPGLCWGLSGEELADQMAEQTLGLGICFLHGHVSNVEQEGNWFWAKLSRNSGEIIKVRCRAVVLATGTEPITATCTNADWAHEKGLLHYDVRTLPRDLSGAKILICGGGDAAFDAAVTIMRRKGSPEIFMRGQLPKARSGLIRQVLSDGTKMNHGMELAALIPEKDALLVEFRHSDGTTKRISADYIVICFGRTGRSALWNQLSNSHGDLDENVETDIPGVFVAGDLIHKRCRFVAPALGDGTRAGWLAERFLSTK